MISFDAKFYDGQSSKIEEVKVIWTDSSLQFELKSGESKRYRQGSFKIEPQLGSIDREFHLFDGGMLRTKDFESVKYLEQYLGLNTKSRFVNFLEKSYRWALSALVVVCIAIYFFITQTVPWLAKEISFKLDQDVLETVSDQVMKIIDLQLDDSELSNERKQELTRRFNKLTRAYGIEGFNYKLIFKKKDDMANAFALPSGKIVLFDGLVDLSIDDREIDSVLLHEIAHVNYRHGMQQTVNRLGLSLIFAAWLGDASSLSELPVAIGTSLLENQCSRTDELEADAFAIKAMRELKYDTKFFADILTRLHNQKPDEFEDDSPEESKNSQNDNDNSEEESYEFFAELFSTHPLLQERLKQITKVEENPGK